LFKHLTKLYLLTFRGKRVPVLTAAVVSTWQQIRSDGLWTSAFRGSFFWSCLQKVRRIQNWQRSV